MNQQLQSALRYLADQQLKLVTAESCTAGLIASTLAELPGGGHWLECAFVTYSADAKIAVLGVRPETIDRCNLTSEAVAREMAEGALRLSRANAAVADTGVAGPASGEGGIPAGTVCFAWAFQQDGQVATFSETRHFQGDRNAVRQASSDYAIARIWHYHTQLQQSAAGGSGQNARDAKDTHGSQHGSD